MIRALLGILLLVATSLGEATPIFGQIPNSTPKLLLDARNCKIADGWQRPILYGHNSLDVRVDGKWQNTFPAELTKSIAKKHDATLPAILNIEFWKLPSEVDKLVATASAWRATAPGKKFGFYELAPLRKYWEPINKTHPIYEPLYEQWLRDNQAMQVLADQVDIIFPSLYSFYPDKTQWTMYAESNVIEAKKYGKPVMPFLWTRLHPNGARDNDGEPLSDRGPLPADLLKYQIEWCYANCDGVVVWDWVDSTKSGVKPNDDTVSIMSTKVMQEFAKERR